MKTIINQEIISRIGLFLEKMGLSRSELATMLGKTKSTLISQLNGTRGMSIELLNDIFTQFPILNKDWVFTGRGDMELGNDSRGDSLVTYYETRLAELEEQCKKLQQEMDKKDAQIEVLKSVIKRE